MPLPKPKKGEKQNEFMTRCLDKALTEFPKDQAMAVCYDIFRNDKNK
jgi:hypothetical protein|tara:strand:+ start:8955 stop:9095 length:141 start_codon:yes stop_codon:yes gene_type:complete